MLVAILALLGVLVSLYMLAYALGMAGSLICSVGDCEAVQSSPFSRIGPFPVAAFGVVGYLALMVVSLLGLQPAARGSRLVPLALLLGGVAGVAFSAYLTYLEAFVIRAWCQWCVGSAAIMVLVLLGVLPEVRRLGSPR
ncbi:MAG: vitamin K epoxide reductase family protein [Gemmatimonadota bacterium]|jgi:uncharacterized membrane protein